MLILKGFQQAGVSRRIQAVASGIDAVAYLQGTHAYGDREKYPLPALVLLDIKIPGMDGFEVGRTIILLWRRKSQQSFKETGHGKDQRSWW